MTALLIVETVILAVLCVLVAGLLRGYASVLRRLHQLDGGAAAARPRAAAVPHRARRHRAARGGCRQLRAAARGGSGPRRRPVS